MMAVRMAVHENRLSRPELVTPANCLGYIARRGKDRVAEATGRVVGFAIADLVGHNIWALLRDPESEKPGIGRALRDPLLGCSFTQAPGNVWPSAGPGTRAEGCYRRAEWPETGLNKSGAVRFGMSAEKWARKQ